MQSIFGQQQRTKRESTTSSQDNTMTLDCAEILTLAKHKKFDEILELLLQEYELVQSTKANKKLDGQCKRSIITSTTSASTDDTSDSNNNATANAYHHAHTVDPTSMLLHKILAYNPPLEVVDLLCQLLNRRRKGGDSACGRFAGIENVADLSGRTPLHMAAIYNCDSTVLDRIMKRCKSRAHPALALDHIGRTPLHWSVDVRGGDGVTYSQRKSCSILLFRTRCSKQSELAQRIENRLEIVQLLLRTCPRAILVRDKDGNKPIDIARQTKADPDIIMAILDMERELDGNIPESIGATKRVVQVSRTNPPSPTIRNVNQIYSLTMENIFATQAMIHTTTSTTQVKRPLDFVIEYPSSENACDDDQSDISSIGSRGISERKSTRSCFTNEIIVI